MRYLILILLCGVGALQAQDYNTTLLSNVRFTDNCANVWGHVDSMGREYAIIGRTTGTSVFDVTDGSKPLLLVHIPGALGQWREIKSWQNSIYVVADQGQDGILIIDMSDAPHSINWRFDRRQIQVVDETLNINKTDFLNRAHSLFIDEKGYCYISGSNLHPGVVIFKLNPHLETPEYQGILNSNYSHDTYARNDTLWSADVLAGVFTVWDVKDRTKSKKLAEQRTGNSFTHNIWLSDDGKYAFTTDERANAFVEAYRVDDLSNIVRTDHYRSRTTQIRGTIPHNTHYNKGYLVTSYYTDGFTIVDATDPSHLVEVGAYDTYPAGEGDFHGCWGVYPYLPSGNILASDIEFGLYVVKPAYKRASYLRGTVRDSVSGIPLANVKIKMGLAPFNEVLSAGDGSFKTGGPYKGKVSIKISKEGYQAKQVEVDLQTGELTQTDLLLKPLSTRELNIRVIDSLTGQGIPGVFVRFISEENSFDVETNASGRSTQLIYEGKWTLGLAIWSYRFKTRSLILDSQTGEIIIPLTRGYEDNFAFNLGWTTQSDLFRGVWDRAEPRGAYIREEAINPEYDLPDDFGDLCMITGNRSTSATGDDVDNGTTRLISPAMDLSGYKAPIIEFYAWTVRKNLVETIPWVGSHSVYLASGGDTVLLLTLEPNVQAWTKYQITLNPSLIKKKSAVFILFEASEPEVVDARNMVEFGLDGFSIVESSSTPVRQEELQQVDWKAFPSPFSHKLILSGPAKSYDRNIEFISVYGVRLSRFIWARLQPEIQLYPDLPVGIYFIRVTSPGKVAEVVKLIRGE